ncbi:MAG: hypothetical protein IJI46_09370 [Erysipelotrichaceae bacterium]|nr:hypothetical protein [Erysipelotrichaceae bacterium]
MSEKRSGRKKHVVEGEVSEIVRMAEGLKRKERVGESGFMSAFRRIVKGIRNAEEKK